jgi:hypothetical protein
LEEGVAFVEQALGVELAEGGRHAEMGTHNRLLRLGPKLYLEVIAVDPEAPAPAHARWFGLDAPRRGARLTNWILRCGALDRVLEAAALDLGRPMAFQRGDFRWRMAVPEAGQTPLGGACPAVMEWQCRAHPAAGLPDAGCELLRLSISHPKAEELLAALPGLRRVEGVRVEVGPPDISARIQTPTGRWTLS